MFIKSRLVLLFLLLFNSNLMAAVSDKIVAIVNDDVITLSDVNNRVKKFDTKKQDLDLEALQKQALNALIDQAVQLQLADKMSIKVEKKQILNSIIKIAAQQGLSLEEFKIRLKSDGESYQSFYDFVKNQLILAKLQKVVLSSSIKISKADIESFNKKLLLDKQQVHIVDWVFEVDDSSSTSQWRMMKNNSNNLKKLLKKNPNIENFNQAVKTDLGWRDVNSLPDLFINKLRKVKAKSIIGPIKAPNGFHVLYIVDVSSVKSLNNEQVYNLLYFQKIQKKLPEWIKELRSKAVVEIINNE